MKFRETGPGEASCSFCGARHANSIDRALIAGVSVFICPKCIRACCQAIGREVCFPVEFPDPKPDLRLIGPESNPEVQWKPFRCSFCSRRNTDGATLIAAGPAVICGDCLTLCDEIRSDESSSDS